MEERKGEGRMSDPASLIKETRTLLDIAERIIQLPEARWEDRLQQLPLEKRTQVRRVLKLIKEQAAA